MNIRQIIDSFKKQVEPNANMLVELAELQKRNEQRLKAIKQEMGEKYILHKSHMKSRLNEPRPV